MAAPPKPTEAELGVLRVLWAKGPCRARLLFDRVGVLVSRPVAANWRRRAWSVAAAGLAAGGFALALSGTELTSSPASWPWAAWLAAAGLGLAVGLRHAVEPDHLVAVATMVAQERGPRSAARLGAAWGVGHAMALLVLGTLLITARQSMPASAMTALEIMVAAMILVMGVRAVRNGLRLGARDTVQWHGHGDRAHAHAVSAAHVHLGRVAMVRRPVLVGVVHGLAGSGALTALAVASLPTWPAQVVFMVVFGLGSTAGMALVAGAAGWPLTRLVRAPFAAAALSVTTGLAAIAFGLIWAAPLLAR